MDIIADVEEIGLAGNVVEATRLLVAALGDTTPLSLWRAAMAVLPCVFAHHKEAWTADEVERLRDLLKPITPPSKMATDWTATVAALETATPTPPPAGVVNALFAACTSRGTAFGFVQRLRVAAEGAGSERKLEGKAGDEARAAYERGVRAASGFLHGHGFGDLAGSTLIRNFSLWASFDSCALPIDGESIGLAAGIAVLSALLDVPVDPGTAFTGALNADCETLVPVGGLTLKLPAAADAGLAVFAPDGTEGVPAAHCRGKFSHVADHVFGSRIAEGLLNLRKFALGVYGRPWLKSSEDESRVTRHVLLSPVSTSDPSSPRGAGPVLAMCEAHQFHAAHLMYTPDLRTRYEEIRAALNTSGCDVIPYELSTVTDPADWTQVFIAVRQVALAVREASSGDATSRLYINVGSGTPQMRIALHLLVERGILPDYRFEALDPERLRTGQRVRRIVLPLM
jgi:hypothetical protein